MGNYTAKRTILFTHNIDDGRQPAANNQTHVKKSDFRDVDLTFCLNKNVHHT